MRVSSQESVLSAVRKGTQCEIALRLIDIRTQDRTSRANYVGAIHLELPLPRKRPWPHRRHTATPDQRQKVKVVGGVDWHKGRKRGISLAAEIDLPRLDIGTIAGVARVPARRRRSGRLTVLEVKCVRCQKRYGQRNQEAVLCPSVPSLHEGWRLQTNGR